MARWQDRDIYLGTAPVHRLLQTAIYSDVPLGGGLTHDELFQLRSEPVETTFRPFQAARCQLGIPQGRREIAFVPYNQAMSDIYVVIRNQNNVAMTSVEGEPVRVFVR